VNHYYSTPIELLLHDGRRRRRRLVAVTVAAAAAIRTDDASTETCVVVDVVVDNRPTNYTPEQWKLRRRGMIATTPRKMMTMTTCQLVMYLHCCCYHYWNKNLCESFSGLFSALV
jgi:hypothetical protein